MNNIFTYLKDNFAYLFICIIWWFPVTIFGYWTEPVGTELFTLMRFPTIGLCLWAIILQRTNAVSLPLIVFILFSLVATLVSEDILYSGAKFAGLAVVISVFSPLLKSQYARTIRQSLWRNLCWSAVVVVIISIVWDTTGLPAPQIYFKEGNAGITGHAMLFGPVCGIAAVFLLSKALAENGRLYMVLSSICYVACLTSISRSAVLATTAGLLGIFILNMNVERSFRLAKIIVPAILILLLIASYFSEQVNNLLANSDEAFAQKGTDISSREELWEARWEEFTRSPIIGTGIGMSIDYDKSAATLVGGFVGTVEPGSTYLVVLSMTGAMGAVALLVAIGAEMLALTKVWARVRQRRKFELIGVGLLLFAHAFAEGWIYSPGGVVCLFFWLWFGILGDTVDALKCNTESQ